MITGKTKDHKLMRERISADNPMAESYRELITKYDNLKEKAGGATLDTVISQAEFEKDIKQLIELKSKDGLDFSTLILKNKGNGREELILEASTRTAYRKGDWVMIPPYKGPEISKYVNIELGNSMDFKLYNLEDDPSQKVDLSKKEPEKLREMITSFVEIRGRNFSNIENLVLD